MALSVDGKNRLKYFSGRAALGLGVTLIVFGLIVIAAQITIIAVYKVNLSALSQGIWCGTAFVLSGVFGIVAGKRRTVAWVVAHMIICIIATIFAGAVIALSGLSMAYSPGQPYNYQSWPCAGSTGSYGSSGSNGYSGTGYYYTGNTGSTFYSYYTSGMTGYWTNYNTGSIGAPITLGNGGLLTPYNETTAWVQYFTGYLTGYYTQYYNGYGSDYYGPTGCYVMNVPWIVQFSMNIIMGVLGIICAILTVIAATLSCAPLCCSPTNNESQEKNWKAPLMSPAYIEAPPYILPISGAPDVRIGVTDPEDGSEAKLN